MKKRILSIVLIFMMLLSMSAFISVAAEDEIDISADIVNDDTLKYQIEIGFLRTIGIIDDSIELSEKITKGGMAKFIATAIHPELDFTDEVTGTPAFNDVPSSHEFYSYIKACRDLGIVKGDTDNNFNPDKEITAIEAITMVINALGYTPYAEALGGYPTGYFQVASQSGISKSVSVGSTDTISGAVAVKIIYNGLFADIVQMQSITNSMIELEIKPGKNILTERLGIYEYDATVVDNGISSIEGSSISDEEKAVVRLYSNTSQTITAYINGTDISEYLGCRVRAFIRNNPQTGRNEYVYVAPHKSCNVTKVNAKYIFNVTEHYVEYDEDEDTPDYEKIQLAGGSPLIIVNGVKIITAPVPSLDPIIKQVMPKDGIVSFIDNDGDTKADIVSILNFNYRQSGNSYSNSAYNIYADEIITEDAKHYISCAFNPSVSLDLEEDNAGYQFVHNPYVKSIEDVKQGMIISVAECPDLVNGKKFYYLVANEEKVEGTVIGKGPNEILLSDNNEYELSTSITGVKSRFIDYMQYGKATTLYLDVTGKIAYSVTEGGNSKEYAYLVKTQQRVRDGEDVLLAKIFTKNGEMLELPLYEKVIIDGVEVTGIPNQQAALNQVAVDGISDKWADDAGRPIVVEIKEETIRRIDTDKPNQAIGGENKESSTYKTQWAIKYTEDDANSVETLKAGFRSPRTQSIYGSAAKSLVGKFYITDNTTVLSVPLIDSYGLQENIHAQYMPFYASTIFTISEPMVKLYEKDASNENYAVLTAKNILTSMAYDIQGYDIDPDTGVAGLVVLRGRTDCYYYDATPYDVSKYPMSVYSRKTTVYDVDKEKEVTKIYYYQNGVEESGIIDLDDTPFYAKALVNGLSASSPENLYKVDVPALREGDIIRTIKSGDNITHLERVIRTNEYEMAYSYMLFPTLPSGPYNGNIISGTNYISSSGLFTSANGMYDVIKSFPFDMRMYRTTANSSEAICIGYVENVKGSTIKAIHSSGYAKGATGVAMGYDKTLLAPNYTTYTGTGTGTSYNDTLQYNKIGALSEDAIRSGLIYMKDEPSYTYYGVPVEQYIDAGTVTPMIVTIEADELSPGVYDQSTLKIKVENGTLNDIKTLNEVFDSTNGQDDLKDASVVIYKHSSYKMGQLIVINGIECLQ